MVYFFMSKGKVNGCIERRMVVEAMMFSLLWTYHDDYKSFINSTCVTSDMFGAMQEEQECCEENNIAVAEAVGILNQTIKENTKANKT